LSRVAPLPAEAAALVVFAASAALFYLCSRPRVPHSPSYARGVFFVVLGIGLLIRWVLAWYTPGNYDRESWAIAADIFARGGNVYAESARYNSSPAWFWILGGLKSISGAVPLLSFGVLVRLFLSLLDAATALLLWSWPRLSAWERTRQALLFFLNPVSFLLTGVHGQFDGVAVFLLVLALWVSAHPMRGHRQRGWAWFWATAAFWVKHIVCYELWILTFHFFKKGAAALLILVSTALFLASFAPYWSAGKEGILQNVFLYESYAMPYGLANFGGVRWLAPAFMAALAAYSFFLKERRLSTKLLLGALFFLTFTPGLGVQYFILPVAFGALRPTRGFFLYTFVTGLFLLGSYFNLGLPYFSWVPLWSVWVSAALWWADEQKKSCTNREGGYNLKKTGDFS
jgi:hypothetical protein